MSYKVLILSVLLVLLFGVGLAFFLLKTQNRSLNQAVSTVFTGTPNSPSAANPKTLTGLLKQGLAQTCSFPQGMLYLSSGKARVDMSTSHFIYDGTQVYFWTNAQKTGFRMSLDALAQKTQPPSSPKFDPNATTNYDCTSWIADTTMFATPSAVTFTSSSKLLLPSAVIPTFPPNYQGN